MRKNMGNADRVIRLILAAVFAILYFYKVLPDPWGYVLLAFAVIFVLTSLVGFCPLYRLFGMSTCRKA